MATVAKTLAEQVSVRRLSDHEFESIYLPERLANPANIAYGGCALGVAVNAAHLSLPSAPNSPFQLYSATGCYLGPTHTGYKVKCSIRQIRATRTFQTLLVDVTQELGLGKGQRNVLTSIMDFQRSEPASLLEYSARPKRTYAKCGDQPTIEKASQRLADRGLVSQKLVDFRAKEFSMFARFFEQRLCQEGIFAQNLIGMAKHVETTQDHLPISEKTSADYFRVLHPLDNQADQVSSLAFSMDAGVSFMPLSHDHKFLDDVAACSTLDFAIRLFSNNIDINKWCMREWATVTAAAGRTYSECRYWDESGNMIGSMTQQCIARPHAAVKSSI